MDVLKEMKHSGIENETYISKTSFAKDNKRSGEAREINEVV